MPCSASLVINPTKGRLNILIKYAHLLYLHVYTYTCINIIQYTYAQTYTHLHMYIYTHKRTDAHIPTNAYTFLPFYTYSYMYLHMHTYSYMYLHIDTYTYLQINTYIHVLTIKYRVFLNPPYRDKDLE